MPRKTPPNKVNIDELIQADIASNVKKAKIAKVTLLGREWTATEAGSVAAAVDLFSGDEDKAAAAFLDWLVGMITEEEQVAFRSALRRTPGLDVPVMMKIGNAISEAIYGRPTPPSEDNSDNSDVPGSGTPSTGVSSLPVGTVSIGSDSQTL